MAFNYAITENERQMLDRERNVKDIEAFLMGYMVEDTRIRGRKSAKIDMDPFKMLKIRDAFLPENSTLVCKMHNKNSSGKGAGIPINVEVLKSGTVFEVEIVLAFYGEVGRKSLFTKDNFLKILHYWSAQSKTKAKDELDRLNKYSGLELKEKQRLKVIYEKLIADKGIILRAGFGSGYDFMTVKGFRSMKEPVKGKPGMGWGFSKNIVEGGEPLGFLKLSLKE